MLYMQQKPLLKKVLYLVVELLYGMHEKLLCILLQQEQKSFTKHVVNHLNKF